MSNNWETLLVHSKIEDVCVPPPPKDRQDELWRLTESIPCTGIPGVEGKAAEPAPENYTLVMAASPSPGGIPVADYSFWSSGSGSVCLAPKEKPEPELDEIRQPPEEKLCGVNECEDHELLPGCPYDFPVMRAAKAVGQHNPGCFVLRVGGLIVFNQIPVITPSAPEPAPGPRLGVHPSGYYAELTPSSVCDLQTKCTQITYAEGYEKPGGLNNV